MSKATSPITVRLPKMTLALLEKEADARTCGGYRESRTTILRIALGKGLEALKRERARG
jgi:hypothetical protein